MFLQRILFHILAVLFLDLSLSCATQDVKLLPKPSGPFAVAINNLELIDTSRLDPFAPTKTPRRIMVSAIYPVEHTPSTCRYPYMPPLTAGIEDAEYRFPAGTYESLFLQVGCGSKPRDDAPLVIFSPAQGNTRLDYSLLVSNVASYGFTIIMMDHPYDADIVEFPDGTYITADTSINTTTFAQTNTAAIEAIGVRTQDTTFVLDQLANETVIDHLIPGRTCALNTSEVAMFGHSLGGATAASAMVNDTRIKGGLDMDGAIFNASDVLHVGLDRPFLLFGHENSSRLYNGSDPGDIVTAETWAGLWSVLSGWRLELELADSLHYTFSDFPSQLQTLGIKLDATDLVTLLSGNDTSIPPDAVPGIDESLLKADTGRNAVVSYVVAFLELVLKGKKEGLLSGPSVRFPEVWFV
jgi:hypothetical protein